jgi:2',3'-cyclic-nucleotide 2'-phosphodiesterase (5'-nucleotidase family)
VSPLCHRLPIALLLVLFLGSCPARWPVDPRTGLVEVTVIGTSDLHGRLWTLPLLGGYLRALREARPGRVVLVDSGDVFQGTLESDEDEGETVIRAYRELGYHAVAIGNHEFDFGPVGPAAFPRSPADDPRGALKARALQARGAFPLLVANLTEDGRPLAWENVFPSTLVRLAGGLLVGIVGVTTERIARAALAANFRGLAVTPAAQAIEREARALRRRGAQIVVVAAHAGTSCQSFEAPEDLSSCSVDAEIFDIARALPRGLVDVIAGGHSHGGVAHRVNGIPVVEAYAHGQAFARVDLLWDPKQRKVVESRLHPPTPLRSAAHYEGRPVEEDPLVLKIVAAASRKALARRRQALGVEIREPFRLHHDRESALGNLVASLMLEAVPRGQAALIQAGGIRASLPRGPLDYGALYEALPFQNRLVVVTLSGKALRDLFRVNLTSRRSIYSVAGLRVRAQCQGGQLVVEVSLEPRGSPAPVPLGDDVRVPVVVTDFLAAGGDGFPEHPMAVPVDEPSTLREAVAQRLRARGGTMSPAEWLDPGRPRLAIPSPKPVRCAPEGAR